MIGILMLSHGSLCKGALDAMEVLGCDTQKVEAIPLYMETELETYHSSIAQAIDRLDSGEGVLILVDILSGTPFNRSCILYEQKHIQVVAGLSLPMCVTALDFRREQDLETLARTCLEEGRESIVNLKDLLD